MHRMIIHLERVIYGGRHCRRAKIFYLSQLGIEPRSLDLQANTLPYRCKADFDRKAVEVYCICLTPVSIHAREPLNSNSAVLAGWLQSTRTQNSVMGNILVNILFSKIFFANYCHIYIHLCICLYPYSTQTPNPTD